MKIIKVNKINGFFNSSSTKLKEYYENGDSFVFKDLDKNEIIIPSDEIYTDNRLKTLCFNLNDEKYIIYHPYYQSIIKNGYLVYDKYDEIFVEDKEKGKEIYNSLFEKIIDKANAFNIIDQNPNRMECEYKTDKYEYKIIICSINEIFKRNQERKINNLPFFSFDKKMDKYGTMYVAIYCKPIFHEYNEEEEIEESISILNKFIDSDNNIKYVDIEPRASRIYYII